MSDVAEETGSSIPDESSSQVLDPAVIRQQIHEAMADPMDLRSDKELAEDLGIHPATIRALRRNPEFFGPVLDDFKRNLSSSLIEVIKNLQRQAARGSAASAKLLLQALGLIQEGNVVVFNQGGSGGSSFQNFSDLELDRMLEVLLQDVQSADVTLQGGKVAIAESQLDWSRITDAVVVEEQEGEAGGSPARKAEEVVEG